MTAHPVIPERLDDEDWTDWHLRANQTVSDNPPAAPDGFLLLPCEATPRHWPTYVIDDGETGDYIGCPNCVQQAADDAHRTCRHDINHRGPWRRWKLTRKVVSKLYALGVVRGFGTTHGGGCNGCVSGIHWTWFSGPYVLFVARETWRCWRQGHRRGDEIGFGYCAKCIPWYCCGSTKASHADDCTEASA